MTRTLNKPTRPVKTLLILPLLCAFLGACTGIPDGIEPVKAFNGEKYLGTWYEIARLDHSFEEGLEQVTAEYQWRDNGGISVTNKGYNTESGKWSYAKGKAFFKADNDIGHLKVSFFGPFYGSYIIFELDDDYQYAFITSYNKEYLWLLSRTPKISSELKNHFTSTIKKLGFEANKLIWVSQQ